MIIKKLRNILFLLLFVFGICNACEFGNKKSSKSKITDVEIFEQTLQDAQLRYNTMIDQMGGQEYSPRSYENGNYIKSKGWTAGFFPGTLWYLYEYTGEEHWKIKADRFTRPLEFMKTHTNTHDLGFIFYCSYGNAYRLTKDKYYRNVILSASESLSTRFNPIVGCIKSWDWSDKWKFPVIVDNLMNLEMLFWASNESGDTKFTEIAISHADKTLENHFREDYSSFHVVDYIPDSGSVKWAGTFQGDNDASSWARGQAWTLYGYTMIYRETGDEKYLKQAKGIADYIIQNLPEDYVPWWDFSKNSMEDEPRDASAASIYASALIELSGYTKGSDSENYLETARQILRSLCTPNYSTTSADGHQFLLKHSTGHKPADSEIDVPLSYADYYFVEALVRYLKIEK